jgi:hypothetical protein
MVVKKINKNETERVKIMEKQTNGEKRQAKTSKKKHKTETTTEKNHLFDS